MFSITDLEGYGRDQLWPYADPSGRALAGIVGSIPSGVVHLYLSLVSVVCRQVAVSATG